MTNRRQKKAYKSGQPRSQFIEDTGPEGAGAEAKTCRALVNEPVSEPVYAGSWLNFVRLVLLTVQRDVADPFRQLKGSYKPMTQEQKGFDELLDDIGEVFFNIPRPRKQGNMLQDLMSSLFVGGSPQLQHQQLTSGSRQYR
ncbi:hypothetical protein BJV82DRAFT_670242 [Fennellomyces sp. T-0311]|nr:hypothetical protein BJV82DRAFT_670242 [Fennellomyces sp. T-0311]